MSAFQPATERALRTTGWVVFLDRAVQKQGDTTRRVSANGEWIVRRGGRVIAQGKEPNAAHAAMEANEAAWAALKETTR